MDLLFQALDPSISGWSAHASHLRADRLTHKSTESGPHASALDAIPVGIRDNLGNRLVLKVAGEAGSMLELKAPDAERLPGKGHVAARLSGDRPEDGEHFVAQTLFASTADLADLGRGIPHGPAPIASAPRRAARWTPPPGRALLRP